MSDFSVPVDIGNRGLQHLGAGRISSFDEDSTAASAVSFCYDKLRRAELRRNVWRFAIRTAVLRPIDTDTLILVPSAYSAAASYAIGTIVSHDGTIWQTHDSLAPGSEPGVSASWEVYCSALTISPLDADTAYSVGELVYDATDVYLSLQSDNDATPPTAAWVKVGTVASNTKASTILYPLGSGPRSQVTTSNAYMLPAGFLRKAPKDPRMGMTSPLGAPGNLAADDWNFEGQYITTGDVGTLVLRFVADTRSVASFDPMFCEGLGVRIAVECCEELTQSTEKLATLASAYKMFMGEARTINAIETGATEPPLDDWLAARF